MHHGHPHARETTSAVSRVPIIISINEIEMESRRSMLSAKARREAYRAEVVQCSRTGSPIPIRRSRLRTGAGRRSATNLSGTHGFRRYSTVLCWPSQRRDES